MRPLAHIVFFFVFTLVYRGEKSKVTKNEKYYVGFLIQKI